MQDNLDSVQVPTGRSVLLAMSWYDHRTHLGISRFAKKHGWRVDARMANSTEMAWGWRGDGVITKIGCSTVDEDLREFITQLNCPTIDLSMFGPDLGFPSLEFDPAQIGRLAAKHFLERGLTNFAWFPYVNALPITMRREGFESAIQQLASASVHRIPIPESTANDTDWTSEEILLARHLATLPRPIAVLCFNDEWGSRIIRACETAGLRVPEDVAVLGVDDNQLICEHQPVTLSSVQLDLEYWGMVAAAKLGQLMGKPVMVHEPKLEFIAPRGISVRESTDVISVDHSDVLQAAKYIAERYKNGINTSDVIRHGRLSSSGLKQAFRKHLGRTINDEIRRVRYEHTRRLLVETDWTLDRIANEVGLNDARSLHRLFALHHDETPNEYRRKLQQHPS